MAANHDFIAIWSVESTSCDATRNSAPFSAIEQLAYTTSGYTDPKSITALYEICSVLDKDDLYVSPSFYPSESLIAERSAALVLCPNHPQAAEWSISAARGREAIELERSGRMFSSGAFQVGTEIQPGTYAVEGEINDCYWERLDRNGEIIDNNFVNAAKRVQVTIRKSDYSFNSERCGQWKPAK